MTLKQAKESFSRAKKFLAAAENAVEARDQALSMQAAAMELVGKGDKAKVLRNLRRIERQKCTFKKLKRIFKDIEHGRLSSILTLQEKQTADEPDRWICVTDSDTIQKLIQQRNEAHFNQALETPIGDPAAMQQMGWNGDSEICNDILAGHPPANLSERLQNDVADEFFRQFKAVAPLMETEFTFQEFKETFANWKESTTTSPLKRHLGHYRSLFAPDGQIDKDDIGGKLLMMHYQMMCTALVTGMPLERWQSCISCHIEKDKGSPNFIGCASYTSMKRTIIFS